MQITSYFIGLAIRPEYVSDIFVKIYDYIRQHSIESICSFQNPLSPHITLYYVDKDIDMRMKKDIQSTVQSLHIHEAIHIIWWDYFLDADGNPSLLYLTPHTRLPLGDYRYEFHRKWQQVTAPDSAIPFVPHITVLKIQNPELFEVHRNNIEALIDTEIRTIQHLDVNARNIALYAVNSKFREEIQIPLS